jgi:3-hydroxybenzoate 6-monooxygenase
VQYPVRRGELGNQVATFDTRRYPSDEDIGRQVERVFERTCAAVAHGVELMDHSRRWPMVDRAPCGRVDQGKHHADR